MENKTFYQLGRHDVDKGAIVLGRAFHEYPTFRHLFPDARTRADALRHVMRFLLKCGLLRGEVFSPTDQLEAIAVWYRSDRMHLGFMDVLRAGVLGTVIGLGPSSFGRFKRLGELKRINRDETIGSDYWLLDIIGVDPAEAGRGHARKLILPKLRQADRENRVCYLETSDQTKVGLYQKFGFYLTKTYRFEGLESFCLRRTPSGWK
jgi:ribosomal protein S18 acetylase RimI-like enzyme